MLYMDWITEVSPFYLFYFLLTKKLIIYFLKFNLKIIMNIIKLYLLLVVKLK